MSSGDSSQLLAIGKQCSHASCLLVDFLPFKCQHCEESFCQEHFKVAAHQCPEYDESKYNRVAPDCPLCNTPVAVRPGQDPNDRMEDHFLKECPIMTGKASKPRTTPVCARGNCKKILFSPISCDKCRKDYCPAHRFPADHTCTPVPPPKPGVSNLLTSANTKAFNSKASAVSVATITAIKKAAASVNTATPSLKAAPVLKSIPIASTKSTMPAVHSNPFSKTDRRAKGERESRMKAMQVRAKKGLLSDEEKAILTAEEAAAAERKNDCIIM